MKDQTVTETGWARATTNPSEAMMGLTSCLQSGHNAWIEVRKNGDQKFPIMRKNPELDNPFNWTMSYGTTRNEMELAKKDYFNDTERDLTYNWTYCSGDRKAIEVYEKEGRIIVGLICLAGIGHPVRIADANKYRKEIEGNDIEYGYFVTYWKPKEGIPYEIIDEEVDEVFVICYNNEPFDKADALRKAGRFLIQYADHVDRLAGWEL